MAQAGSAQREPSMEEILASIRRIIEDSDSGGGQPGVTRPEDDGAAGDADGEVETFRNELEAPAAAERRTAPPLRLAEVQTRIREEQAGEDNEDDDGLAGMTEELERSSEAFWPVNDRGDPAMAATEQTAGEPEESDAIQPAEQRPAIISDLAGRKVMAAFEELNEAFEESRRQSLGEMAEDMLRPMLQDWLDNNLPTLVERLVREEIERVARGGADR